MKKTFACLLSVLILCCSLVGCEDNNLTEYQKQLKEHQKEIKKTAVECTIRDLPSMDGYCLIKGNFKNVTTDSEEDAFYSGTVVDKNKDSYRSDISKDVAKSAGVTDISKCTKFYGKLTENNRFTIFYLE